MRDAGRREVRARQKAQTWVVHKECGVSVGRSAKEIINGRYLIIEAIKQKTHVGSRKGNYMTSSTAGEDDVRYQARAISSDQIFPKPGLRDMLSRASASFHCNQTIPDSRLNA